MTGIGKQAQLKAADDFCVSVFDCFTVLIKKLELTIVYCYEQIFMQPDPINQNLVDAEAVAVSYCFNPYNNTRPMPDGFILTSHFVSLLAPSPLNWRWY